MRRARELADHRARFVLVRRLPVQASVEVDGRVDAERDRALRVHRAGLALGVRADELDRVGIGRVVLLVRGSDDVERDPRAARGSPVAAARSRRGRAVITRLLRDPDLLRGPLPRPLGRERVVVRVVDRVVGRVELDEVDDVEARVAGGAGRARRAAAATRRRARPATRGARAHAAAAAAPRSARPRRARRGSRACCCGGTRAVRPGGGAGAPRESSGAGRTRCSRRTRRRRGRSSRTGSGTSSALASTSGNSIPNSA